MGTLDLTERKQAQEVLERSDARFAALIEHGRDVITIVDADTALLYARGIQCWLTSVLGQGAPPDVIDSDGPPLVGGVSFASGRT